MTRPKPSMWWPGINRGHPLTMGLRAAWPFWRKAGGSVVDVVRAYTLPFTSAPVWVGTAGGGGLDFDGSDDVLDGGNILNPGTKDMTAAIFFKGHDDFPTGGSGGRLIQKRGTGSFNSTPGYQLCVRRQSSNLLLDNTGLDDDNVNSRVYNSNADIGLVVGQRALLSIERETDEIVVRLDGNRVGGDPTGGGISGSLDTVEPFTIGATETGGTQFASMTVEAAYVWGRSLGDELKELAADPFALFRPRQRTYIFQAGIAAGITDGELVAAATSIDTSPDHPDPIFVPF